MRAKCYGDYQHERDALTSAQIDQVLESGRQWDVSAFLRSGGVAVFPHTFVSSCGSFIAATVHAALDSGADQVLALGVLHATTKSQKSARADERERNLAFSCPLRAIFGPDLPGNQELFDEYSLLTFLFLWREEIARRGCRAPKLYCRYPYLVNRAPETLPGMKELEEIAKDSVLVATSDFCHHGVAYGAQASNCLAIGDQAYSFAQKNIEEHMKKLHNGSYEEFYNHCLAIRSDSFDVGSVIKHLRAPQSASILALTLVDTASLYEGEPSPSWVAASLVAIS